jgi:hypothetical protein
MAVFGQFVGEKTNPISKDTRPRERNLKKRTQSGENFSRNNKRYAILPDNITQSVIPVKTGIQFSMYLNGFLPAQE